MLHVRHYNKRFLIDDSDHVNVRKHNVSIQIISHVVQWSNTVPIISMRYIDLNHEIYRQNIVIPDRRFRRREDDLFLKQFEFARLHWISSISGEIKTDSKSIEENQSAITSPIRCRNSERIGKCSGLTVINTRHTSDVSSKYDICA